MAYCWGALIAVEAGWVLGPWLLLPDRPSGTSEVHNGGRALFAWAYFLYHLPLLLLGLLVG